MFPGVTSLLHTRQLAQAPSSHPLSRSCSAYPPHFALILVNWGQNEALSGGGTLKEEKKMGAA